jgi:hypothetical protein
LQGLRGGEAGFATGQISRLLKKASCLFQNTKSKKCDFYCSHEINEASVADFAGTSELSDHMFQLQAAAILQISTAC